MDKSILVKIIGFPATLIHGDPLVLDRWRWLRTRIPLTRNKENLIDIGCGTGAFSIGAALRGYNTLGLSWNKRNQNVAGERAKICKAMSAKFEVLDVRELDKKKDLINMFDVAICFENIEHIIDDQKLFRDMSRCLKPGGRLLLTTPYLLYHSMTGEDSGPFSNIENGYHVRRGYTKAMLEELCADSGLLIDEISYCGGFISQKITKILRYISIISPLFGWVIILPLRILPIYFDKLTTSIINWPYMHICLEAYKPRFDKNKTSN